jgi:hypothetical protein
MVSADAETHVPLFIRLTQQRREQPVAAQGQPVPVLVMPKDPSVPTEDPLVIHLEQFVDAVDENLLCPICSDVMTKPVSCAQGEYADFWRGPWPLPPSLPPARPVAPAGVAWCDTMQHATCGPGRTDLLRHRSCLLQ